MMKLPTPDEEVRFSEHWSPNHMPDVPFLFDEPDGAAERRSAEEEGAAGHGCEVLKRGRWSLI